MNRLIPKIVSPLALALVAGSVGLAIVLFGLLRPEVAFIELQPDADGSIPTRFDVLVDQVIFMAVIALFIERAVQTYLVATGIHDDRVIDKETNTEYRFRPIGPYALTVGAVVSSLVALSGIRLLETVIDYSGSTCTGTFMEGWNSCGSFLIGSTDIILTVGLLAAGSAVLHEIVSLIPTMTGRVKNFVAGTPNLPSLPKAKVLLGSVDGLDHIREAVAFQTVAKKSAAQHTIRIDRGSGSTGVLYFHDATQKMDFPCRWDPNNRISPGAFPRCSRTMMATKNRPAIHMPGATLHGRPNNNIFIHRGRDESWSDGCFVLDDDHMSQLLAAIPDADAFNITITVRDL